MRVNSIRFKISVLYTLILGMILVIYSAILYLSLKWTLYGDIDDELRLKAWALTDTINSYVNSIGSGNDVFLFAAKRAVSKDTEGILADNIVELEKQWLIKRDKLDMENDYIDILSSSREVLAGSGDLPKHHFSFLSMAALGMPDREDNFTNTRFENRNLRVINRPISNGDEKYIIQIGTSLKPIIELLRIRLNLILMTIPLILIGTSLVGRFLVSKILKPVRDITTTAKDITHENLNERVDVGQADEEMRYLVVTFNDMIGRLRSAFDYIHEFSSHVAHEIKTPLAVIRGEAELALKYGKSPEEYKGALKSNLDEVRRILKIVDDLLLLTKLQHEKGVSSFERCQIEEIISELSEKSKILAADKNILVKQNIPDGRTFIMADKTHIRRLFYNLINNALKFTPAGGVIDISLKRVGESASVSITDTGTGIQPEHIDRIFEKFFRSNVGNSDVTPGTGLGLSIALEIARTHKGDIKAKSEPGKGSTFTVTLPAV